MAKGGHPVHFANFICHVGDAELADALEDVVIPAFLSQEKRSFRDVRYFLHQVEVTTLQLAEGPAEPVILGRLVKDMVVRSEQQFDATAGELVKANEQLRTAPSAFFVLLLKSHKLVYCHETSGAPTLDAFKGTIGTFLSHARGALIQRMKDLASGGNALDLSLVRKASPDAMSESETLEQLSKGPTLKLLRSLIPDPELEVVPLGNEETLEEFIQRFKVLELASVRLLKRNAELDNDAFFEQVRGKADKAGSDVSTITLKSKSGLIKPVVAKQLQSAISGNAEVVLSGKDETEQRLRGNNDSFKTVAKVDAVPALPRSAATVLFGLFRTQIKKGLVKLAKSSTSQEQLDRVDSVVAGMSKGGADG